MTVLKSLKPTRNKVIVSLIVLFVWYFLISILFSTFCNCRDGGFDNCTDYEHLSLVSMGCHCSCTTVNEAMIDNFILILPSLITYIIYSSVQHFKEKIKNS